MQMHRVLTFSCKCMHVQCRCIYVRCVCMKPRPRMTMKLTLVSHKLCPYVQRAVIALAEKQVPFERIDIDLADKPEWFKAISPLGKVPLLRVSTDSGEAALFES